jgi:putative transposase
LIKGGDSSSRHMKSKWPLAEFWGKGCYISTVGKHGDQTTMSNYEKKLGNDKTYEPLHQQQLKLWG